MKCVYGEHEMQQQCPTAPEDRMSCEPAPAFASGIVGVGALDESANPGMEYDEPTPLELRPEVDDLLDESDLSDATQARPEDVAPLPEPEYDGPLPPGCVATRIGSAVLEVMAPPEDVADTHTPEGIAAHEDALLAILPRPAPAAYVISDEEGLRRAFSAIRHARRRLEQNKRMQAPEVEALQKELAELLEANAKANEALEEEIAHKERAITVYAQLHRKDVLGSEEPRKGEKKTRDYGIGRISYRKEGGDLRLRSEPDAREKVIAWARSRWSDVIEERWEVNLQALKKALAGTDEVPPGMERVPESESISVKVGEEK